LAVVVVVGTAPSQQQVDRVVAVSLVRWVQQVPPHKVMLVVVAPQDIRILVAVAVVLVPQELLAQAVEVQVVMV